LDRNFVIGYFLPTAALVAIIYGLLTGLGFPASWFASLSTNDPLVGTTLIAVGAWLIAIVLLAANRSIYRLMEGYGGILNPVSWLGFVQKRRYKQLLTRIANLDKQFLGVRNFWKEQADLAGSSQARVMSGIRQQRAKLLRRKAEEFPGEESRILPTRFGNIIRAFEDYSRLVYGFEDIQGWDRLLTVIPTDFRNLIDNVKAQTDFWVNLWFVSCVTLVVYVGGVVWILTLGTSIYDKRYDGHWQSLLWSSTLWYLAGAIVLGLFASWGAKRTAVEWGNVVKAAYDTFLPELAQKLGFRPDVVHKKDPWVSFSRLIIYHDLADREHLIQHYLSAPGQDPADTEVQKQCTHEHEELLKAQVEARHLRAELDAKQNKSLWKKLLGR